MVDQRGPKELTRQHKHALGEFRLRFESRKRIHGELDVLFALKPVNRKDDATVSNV